MLRDTDTQQQLAVRLLAFLVLLGAGVACGREDASTDALRPLPVQPAPDVEDDPDEPLGTVPPFLGEAIEGTRVVSFLATDETRIAGRVFGDDRDRSLGVLLLHRSDADMRSWFGYAQQLMERGYVVLAFDFRGYGQSEGEREPAGYPRDVEGALGILRAFGAERIAVAGSGTGGTAALQISEEQMGAVSGVVTIASDASERDDVEVLALDEAGDDPEADAGSTSEISAFIEKVVGTP